MPVANGALRDVLYSEILPTVQKPSRYLGTELNSTHKDLNDVELRVALVFPDLYDLGLGNLGILILYAILNQRPWCWCERAYTPAPDMEAKLRERGLPLFTNESKDPLGAMDLIGFTLQSELTYTNILNALDLSGIPLRTEDRDDSHPLTMAGGPSVFNPEPLAPFLDFFVIGEGEDVILEIVDLLRTMKNATRMEKLEALALLDGIYVPELYPFETLPDGRILPVEDAPKIVKRTVQDLDGATFPTNYIVPYTKQVHDRVGLEVLRGCTQGCRFCQAGMVTRPVRERSLEKVDELMERTLAATGYEEVSLVSLSTCDFSRPRMLVEQAARRAAKDNVSVSLPSLRLDSFSVELADMVAGVRRSGLTFAPEAATPRLRALINKWIPDDDLLNMSSEAYQRGWNHVKTYFMIGLPTERDEDVEAIVDLCVRTVKLGRTFNPKAKLNTGVSTFVPKPFTPFQWAEQITLEEAYRRQGILERGFKNHAAIKFGRHEPETTFIEGLLTRADRRGADLLEAAWRNGARLESWGEYLNFPAWLKAVEDTNYDVKDALRERALDERLPWDHIDMLIPKSWFQEDWQRAMELKHAQDCRAGKCHLCGVIYRERDLCKHMLKRQKQGRIDEQNWKPTPIEKYVEPEAVQRLRFRIGRIGEVQFLSHLEMMNAWVRALRRARAPLSYSQGFHAHPKITFATAAPVGEESMGDYMDIVLKECVEPRELLNRVQATLATGFRALSVEEVPLRAPALMAACSGFAYSLTATGDAESISARISEIVGADEVLVERDVKVKDFRGRERRQKKDIDIRPMIARLELVQSANEQAVIEFDTCVINGRTARPREIALLIGLEPSAARVMKRDTFLQRLPDLMAVEATV
ncbi:MAG: TIGR03960 family B12-binding radical SAM protein [Candidatus Hydrogenedentes bacterium]|nr:TIGR03960 family B12-binding radical SAM protein [Candidatus Hydrogenedentota bacterium]